ncbi:MAG: glycosyltransferase [Flavobacteriaceae bacterium]|jgi:glycosyltransferase involved in cell wall biosynthesis|nr:glycosyltransferase [Flavobacteriaceae bacterium]
MPQNRKILFIYYKLHQPGGVVRVLSSLANELVNQYEVTILVLMSEHKPFYSLDTRIKLVFIDSFSHWAFSKVCVAMDKYLSFMPKKQNIKNYFYDFGAYSMLNNWLNENHERYDTIISCWYKLSIGISFNKKVNKRTIAWEHTNFEVGSVFYKKLRKQYKILKSIVYLANPARDYYFNLNNNSYLIPNIIGGNFESSTKINLNDKQNIIISVGRLYSTKNISELVTIFSNIKNKKNWKLNIIGDGEKYQEIKSRIEELNLTDSVFMLGEKTGNEVYDFLSKSKIFALTSSVEGLPLVLIEAMLCANILVAYDCKTGPSDIINENNGFLINLYDKETFTNKLQYLIDNEEITDKLIQSSYQESNRWRKEEIIKKWGKIL